MDVPFEQTVSPRRMPAWIPLLGAVLLLVAAPLLLSSFQLNLLGKFLTYALVALSLDLIWGYAGILSLGHGLFFGLGAYAMAMYLKLEASAGRLPDFMSWSGLEALPLFWVPFRFPAFAIAMAMLVPMLLAAVVGWLIFRSRIQGVYFSIITQALAMIATLLFVGQQPITGGTNGITDLKTIFGYPLAAQSTQTALYLVTAVILLLVYLLLRRLVSSRFGRLLVAMRDDETRVRFLGYNPVVPKTMVFALSAGIAGLAGALFVPQVGIISPTSMGVVPSLEFVIWVAVGGRGTLIGAIVGALLVNYGKSGFSAAFPEFWQFFMGALCVGAVLFFPLGLVGSLDALRRRWQPSQRPASSSEPASKRTAQLASLVSDEQQAVAMTKEQ